MGKQPSVSVKLVSSDNSYDWEMVVPTREHVESVTEHSRNGDTSALSSYGKTIRDLMLAGFCLLFACSPALSEDVFKPTGRYAQGGSTTCNESSGRYLVCFSASWCSPCQAWKRSEQKKIEAAGHTVMIVEDGHVKWGVERIPQFWIVDRGSVKPIEKITGYTSAETLLAKLKVAEPLDAARLRNVSGDSGSATSSDRTAVMSHGDMVALHNRLHGGGSWNWPGDLASHLQTAHGQSITTAASKPVVRIQSSCPGGNCPTPTNRAQQRREGFLRGLFR